MLHTDYLEESFEKEAFRETKKQKKRRERESPQEAFSLAPVRPLTRSQNEAMRAFRSGENLLLHGTAGTGKSFLGCLLGMENVLGEDPARRLVIIRSTVPSRDQGFLPGGPKEKAEVFDMPYRPIFASLFGRGDAWEVLKKKRVVEFESTSFLRGTTFENCVVFMDEIQNASFAELSTVATRIGKNCRVVFSGDFHHSDLRGRERNGVLKFLRILEEMREVRNVNFTSEDVVRSGFCKSFILAEERLRTGTQVQTEPPL